MATAGKGPIDVTIRIAKTHADRFGEIVTQLEAHGLGRIERHDRFLVVNGSTEPERLDDLRAIAGVASVRSDRTYRAQ
jgi:hypothetical protein